MFRPPRSGYDIIMVVMLGNATLGFISLLNFPLCDHVCCRCYGDCGVSSHYSALLIWLNGSVFVIYAISFYNTFTIHRVLEVRMLWCETPIRWIYMSILSFASYQRVFLFIFTITNVWLSFQGPPLLLTCYMFVICVLQVVICKSESKSVSCLRKKYDDMMLEGELGCEWLTHHQGKILYWHKIINITHVMLVFFTCRHVPRWRVEIVLSSLVNYLRDVLQYTQDLMKAH